MAVDHLFFNRIDSRFHLLKRNSRRSDDHRIGFHFHPQVRGTADVVDRLTERNGIRGHGDLATGSLFGIFRVFRVRCFRSAFRRLRFRKQENIDSLLRRIRLRGIALFRLLGQIAQGNRNFDLFKLKTVDDDILQFILNGGLTALFFNRTFLSRRLSGESDLRRQRREELPFRFRLVFLFRKSLARFCTLEKLEIDSADRIDRGDIVRINRDHFFVFVASLVPLLVAIEDIALAQQNVDAVKSRRLSGIDNIGRDLPGVFDRSRQLGNSGDHLFHFILGSRPDFHGFPAKVNCLFILFCIRGSLSIEIELFRPVVVAGGNGLTAVFRLAENRRVLRQFLQNGDGLEIKINSFLVSSGLISLSGFADKRIRLGHCLFSGQFRYIKIQGILGCCGVVGGLQGDIFTRGCAVRCRLSFNRHRNREQKRRSHAGFGEMSL